MWIRGGGVTAPEVYDRREQAREAYRDARRRLPRITDTRMPAIDAAIETATYVLVDKGVCAAAWQAHEARTAPMEGPGDPEFIAVLIAAFKAAGFEVEE